MQVEIRKYSKKERWRLERREREGRHSRSGEVGWQRDVKEVRQEIEQYTAFADLSTVLHHK